MASPNESLEPTQGMALAGGGGKHGERQTHAGAGVPVVVEQIHQVAGEAAGFGGAEERVEGVVGEAGGEFAQELPGLLLWAEDLLPQFFVTLEMRRTQPALGEAVGEYFGGDAGGKQAVVDAAARRHLHLAGRVADGEPRGPRRWDGGARREWGEGRPSR